MWCKRKRVRWIGAIARTPKYQCQNCGMTFVCNKENLNECVPLEVIKETKELMEGKWIS